MEKDAAVKVARQQLSVLEMAETLGIISEECRRSGMDRTSFYEWNDVSRRAERLKDMPPIPKSQPNQTTPETEATILECSLAHLSWGCVKLSDFLKLQGISVFSPMGQKILIRNVCLHAYTDTYGFYAFGFLHTGK